MLNALRRLIFSLLVAVIAMTALASLILRLMTPMLSEYKTDVEQWASQLLQQPISIESINAQMDGFTPKLNLTGVELLDSNREYSIAKFGGLSIHFGIISSLITGKITFDHVELHGLEISLIKDVNGAISVSGLGGFKPANSSGRDGRAENIFVAWLLHQGKVSLYKSHIQWNDVGQQKKLDFPEVSVTIKNSGDRHIIHSMFELPPEIGGGVDIALNLKGDILDNSSWGGEIYLKGDGLKSGALLKGRSLQEWSIGQGVADGEFWGTIKAGRLEQIQGHLLAKEIKLEHEDKLVSIAHFNTQLLLKRIDNDWQLQFSRINFGGALRGKMPNYLQVREEKGGWRVTLDHFNIGALQPLIAAAKPELFGEHSKLHGSLRSTELYYREGVESLRTGLDAIEISGLNGWPGVAGLNGRVELRDGVTTMALNSPKLKLNIPEIFRKKLPILAANGKIHASLTEGKWQVWSSNLRLSNRDLKLNVAMNLQSSSRKMPPFVSITSDINVAKVARLKHYIPDNLLSEGVSGWLGEAFHSGAIKNGQLLIYGQGKNIVERSNGGRMEISLSPKAVDLQFHKKWPKIKHVDADLYFSGRKMVIHSNKGSVLSSGRVDDVVVKVDDFKVPLLEVDGMAHFNVSDGMRYVSLSPLEEVLGKIGRAVTGKGEPMLKLHLAIPLKNNGKGVDVRGDINFQKASLNIEKMIDVDDLNGTLAFNQFGVKRSKLSGRLFGEEIKLAIYKKKKGSRASTFITTNSQFAIQQILTDLKLPWVKQFSGKSRWNAMVEFDHAKKSGLLKIKSNLRGITSRLPHPVNKKSNVPLNFNFKYQFSGKKQKQIDMTLDKRLSVQIKYPKRENLLKDIQIHLGDNHLKPTKYSGLVFTGKASQLNFEKWIQIVPDGALTREKKKSKLTVHVDMQRLHLLERSGSKNNKNKGIDASVLPPINLDINAFKYGSLQLGGVVLVTRPLKNGLTIKKLVVANGNYNLIGDGTWMNRFGTKIDLKLTAKNTGDMLKSLRFNTPLNKGNLTVKGDLSWRGSPMDFTLKKVNGKFNLQSSDGVIENAGSDAGQFLGLLNVNKFLNRIALDFSDVKDKSLSYKTLKGNFRINHGNLYTDDFFMESSQANMLLVGRTGLIKQDYDYNLSVIPQISNAAPVAGLAFGPQVAVALLAFKNLFGKEFDKASMQKYRITGSWDKPIIKKIQEKLKEVDSVQ